MNRPAVGLAVALALVACGGESGPVASSPTPTATTPAANKFCGLLLQLQAETIPAVGRAAQMDPSKLSDAIGTAKRQMAKVVRAAPKKIRDDVELVLDASLGIIEAQGDPSKLQSLTARFQDPVFDKARQALLTYQNDVCAFPVGTPT